MNTRSTSRPAARAPKSRHAAPVIAALAVCAALCAAALPAQAAAPASDVVYRSIETPYPAAGPFHPAYTAWYQFQTVADLDYGLRWGTAQLSAAQVGSFQGSASGLSLAFGTTGITGTMTSSANQFARVQAGSDPIAFVDATAAFRYVHVASTSSPASDVTLFTLNFSSPVQGFSFLGAGISDYGGSAVTTWPSQRIQLDNRSLIDVVAVNPNTIYNPVHLAFGVIAAQPFSSVKLLLPAGSFNDNAALANLTIAVDPAALPVPEPASWALWAAGLAVMAQLARRRAGARTVAGNRGL